MKSPGKMRGMFYSVIAILLLMPIVSYMIVYSGSAKAHNDGMIQKITGDKLASFSRSIDLDLRKSLNIYARRAIGNAVSYIDYNGTYLDDSNLRLKELFLNSTIFGSATPVNSSIYEWAGKIAEKGRETGFSVGIDVTSVEFVPYDSFNVMLQAVVTVNVTYSSTNIYRVENESVKVSVLGYEDPLYTLNTNGLVKNIIAKSSFAITDVTYLDNATLSRIYVPSESGASFLDRLEGRLAASDKYKAMSSNTIGMESIVYQPELLAFGIDPRVSQSYVDYLYFNTTATAGYRVNNSQVSWLRIDEAHASLYGVDLLIG